MADTRTAGAPGPGALDHRSPALLPERDQPRAEVQPPGVPAAKPAGHRRSADPVKLLMHRHRRLCEHAVDPLEIAAGLEAHGLTDRTAARFRHRDVFSLAEELYARVPRFQDHTAPAAEARPAGTAGAPGARGGRTGWAGWTALSLLPGVVCVVTFAGLERTSGQSEFAIALAGAFALSGTLSGCLRRGPLRAEGRTVPAAGLWTYWLLACLLCGDGLIEQLVSGGPDGPWPATVTPLAALAFAVAPAAGCAHLFSVQARRRLRGSRGLADFAAGARPLLLTAVALYAALLTGLAVLANVVFGDAGSLAPTVTLGTLLLLARLLTVHGFPGAAAAGLAAACVLEALAAASVLAARLPGCGALAVPVAHAVQAWGGAAVPALACGAAAFGLLVHGTVVLARASAHT
ncbi:hypothetical protein [Streptomyces sp. NPDC088725]|uniref:hypothetical protein n=1 Tax=Streptomyces sp. NPDC088725 TaxID=3365873 RepID=UPI00380CE31F